MTEDKKVVTEILDQVISIRGGTKEDYRVTFDPDSQEWRVTLVGLTEERIRQIIYEELAKPGSANEWVNRAATTIMEEIRKRPA